MLHLLRLEWLKLKNYIPFRVLMLLYVISMPAIFFLFQSIHAQVDGTEASVAISDPAIFPIVWTVMGYVGNWLNFFTMGIIGVLLVSNEFSYKTLRQGVITGLTRKQIFASKVLIMMALATAVTVFYTVLSLGFGFFNTEYIIADKVMENAHYIALFWLQCMGYMSFAFFTAWLFRSMALSVIFYFFWTMFIEVGIRWAIFWWLTPTRAIHFFPLNAMEDLVPIPGRFMPVFEDLAEQMLKEFGMDLFLTPMESTISTIIYILIFLGLSFWTLNRRDL